MKKYYGYMGFCLEVEIEEGKATYSNIILDSDFNKENFEDISYDELLSIKTNLSGFSIFEKTVLKTVRTIPLGKVMTYNEVAKIAGYSGASRAVGNVLAKNPFPLLIPCHRVIRSDLSVGMYSGGGQLIKKRLLKREGIEFEGDKVKSYLPIRFKGLGFKEV